jgi:hypothetical protein
MVELAQHNAVPFAWLTKLPGPPPWGAWQKHRSIRGDDGGQEADAPASPVQRARKRYVNLTWIFVVQPQPHCRKSVFADMIYKERSIIERAFELARTGRFETMKELEKGLAREGYAKSDPQLHSPSLRKQLITLCRASRVIEREDETLVA